MAFPRGRTRVATGGAAKAVVAVGAEPGRWAEGCGAALPRSSSRCHRIGAARPSAGILAFFRPYRAYVLVVLVAILLTSLIGLVNPLLLGVLLDEVIIGGDYDKLNLYVGLMIVLPIVTGLIGVGQTYLNNVIGQSVMQDLRKALYGHLQRMPLRFFTATKPGRSRADWPPTSVACSRSSPIPRHRSSATWRSPSARLSPCGCYWQMTLISLGLLPFFLYVTYRVGEVRRDVKTETQETIAEIRTSRKRHSRVGDAADQGVRPAGEPVADFQAINKHLAMLQIRQQMIGRWFFMIIGTFFTITPAFVYWYAGVAVNGGNSALTIGDIVAFTTLQSRLFFPLGQMLNVQVEIQARWPCSTGYSSTSGWIPRSSTRQTPSRWIRPSSVAGSGCATCRSATRRRRCCHTGPRRRRER